MDRSTGSEQRAVESSNLTITLGVGSSSSVSSHPPRGNRVFRPCDSTLGATASVRRLSCARQRCVNLSVKLLIQFKVTTRLPSAIERWRGCDSVCVISRAGFDAG